MRILIKFFWVITILSSILGCSPKKNTDQIISQITINSDFQMSDKNYKDLVDTVIYIPLETTGNSMIGRIKMLKVHNNKIFILDDIQSTLLIFTSEGKFLHKIPKGKGPGEIIKAQWLTIDEKGGFLYILDNTKTTLNKYTLDGKFEKEIKLDFHARSVQYIPNTNGFAFYTSFMENKRIETEGNSYNLILTDSKGNIVSKLFPFDRDVNVFNFIGLDNVFSCLDEEVYVFCQFDDKIYKITNDSGIEAIYGINYGNNNQTKSNNYYNEISKNNIHDFDFINEKKYNSNIYRLYVQKQTISHFFISGVYNKDSYFYFFDKNTNKVFKVDGEKAGTLPFFCLDSNANYFISYYSFIGLLNGKDDFSEDKTLTNIINNGTINSNPVVVFFNLKSFNK